MQKGILEYLKKIQIKYKNKKIQINELDQLTIESIEDIYKKNDEKSSFNIVIDHELTIVYILIIIGIVSYYENMKNSEKNILDSLSQGDTVCYKGELYTFEGYNQIQKKEYIKLKIQNKNLINNIPITNAYEISMYNGEATRINKRNNLDIRGKSNITKAIIANLMEIDIGILDGVIEKSNLLVVKGKDKILEVVKSIEIVFEDVCIPYTEIFSVAYWTSSEVKPQILKNTIKENILINITTSMSIALDLIRNEDKIKNVMIIGEKTYRESYETELRALNLFCNIEKLMVCSTWEENSEYEYFLDEENEFEIRAFTEKLLRNRIVNYKSEVSSIQREYYNKVNRFINKEINLNKVESAKLNKELKEIIIALKELAEYSEENNEVLQFLKISYYLCNKFQYSIIPFKYCSKNRENILDKIKILEEKKSCLDESRSEYKIMENILGKIEILFEYLNYMNEKFEYIKINFKTRKNGVIVLRNKEEMESIGTYLMMNRINGLSYKLLNKDSDFSEYDYVIVPFYIENKDIFKKNYIKRLEIISYDREFYKYKFEFNQYTKIMKRIYEKNILQQNEIYISEVHHRALQETESIEVTMIEEEKKIKNILEDNYIRLIISNDYNYDNQGESSSSKFIAKKIVVFKEGGYAFLTENYNVSCIDRAKNDIISKSINEIEIGDEIIFIKNQQNDKNDIVKDIIEKLIDNNEFDDLYGEIFKKNQLWKDSLINYMKINMIDEKEMCERFKLKGKNITVVTLKSWLNGNIIGPRDLSNIKVVAEIVDDVDLKYDIENIAKACSDVRRIQIKIRKIFARMIMNAAINNYEENMLHKLIDEIVENLSDYAYIDEIINLKSIDKEMSSQYVNRINEGEIN